MIFTGILLTVLLGMGSSMALIRVATSLKHSSVNTYVGRVLDAQEALPKIAREEVDVVIFFGSSKIQMGISPRQFDRELAEKGVRLKAFNFGFGGLNPYFQDYLSRRIRDAFVESDKRIKLSSIEFNPFQTTVVQRERGETLVDSFLPLLTSRSELWDLTLDDPVRGVRLFTIRYLRDNVSAEMITSLIGRRLSPQTQSTLVEDETILAKRRELRVLLPKHFELDYPDYVHEDWSYSWQGGTTIPEERSAEALELYRQFYETKLSPKSLENDRYGRIQSADIIDLHLDEELVTAFIRTVENFKEVSDRVEIQLMPRNTRWIQNPPEAIARLERAMARIERETGIAIHNYQDIDAITPEHFDDTTHLTLYSGTVVFTHFIAEQHSAYLTR